MFTKLRVHDHRNPRLLPPLLKKNKNKNNNNTNSDKTKTTCGSFNSGGFEADEAEKNKNNNEDDNEDNNKQRRQRRQRRGWGSADKAYAKFSAKPSKNDEYDDTDDDDELKKREERQQIIRAVPLSELERKQFSLLERRRRRGNGNDIDEDDDFKDDIDEVDDLAGWSRFANEAGIKVVDDEKKVKKVISSSSSQQQQQQISKYKRGGLRPWETQRLEREKKKLTTLSTTNQREENGDSTNNNNNAFVNAGLDLLTAENLNKAGLKRPTEIQKLATPELIKGNSAVILAETGSGKTFAYTLPLMSQVAAPGRGGTKVSGRCCPSMIILVPNVELARQVSKMAELCSIWCQRTDLELPAPAIFSIFGKEKKLVKPTSLKQRKNTNNRDRKFIPNKSTNIAAVKAGNKGNKMVGDMEEAIPEFRRADVLICTPSRLLSLAKDEWVLFGRLKHFVVDECDEMLSRGFASEVKELIDLTYGENKDGLNKFGAKVQYVFAAATLKDSEPIFDSFKGELSWISTGYFGKLHPQLEQEVIRIIVDKNKEEEGDDHKKEEEEKEDVKEEEDGVIETTAATTTTTTSKKKNKALLHALEKRKQYKSLVFAKSPEEADDIVDYLNNNTEDYHAMAFHGKAKERGVVLDDFISGDLKVCVCTDLAARGIDFPELHHVVHYSVAESAAMHIHRTGRTARAGQPGPYYCTVLFEENAAAAATTTNSNNTIDDELRELLFSKSKSNKSNNKPFYSRSNSSN